MPQIRWLKRMFTRRQLAHNQMTDSQSVLDNTESGSSREAWFGLDFERHTTFGHDDCADDVSFCLDA